MEEDICYVCYGREATKVLRCSHKLCYHCYERMNKCPMCRMPYYRSDEIYQVRENGPAFIEGLYEFDDDDDYTFVEFMIDSFALLFIVSSVTFSLIFFFF